MPGAGGAGAVPPAAPTPTTVQAANGTTVVSVAPPAQQCCKQTLPQWLGLSNCCAKIQRLLSAIPGLVGLFAPGLGNTMSDIANQPPLLPVNAPQNLQSSNPAVQTAAQVANEQNQAKQKIAAIQYLATIGCAGCYPGVEEALLASLDDCTESVRFAAAKALYDTTGRPCQMCNSKACCSAKVRERLMSVAYETKDDLCFKESSARVRRMARLALVNCGGDCDVGVDAVPLEGPAVTPTPAPASGAPAVPPAPAATPPATSARSQSSSADTQWASRSVDVKPSTQRERPSFEAEAQVVEVTGHSSITETDAEDFVEPAAVRRKAAKSSAAGGRSKLAP